MSVCVYLYMYIFIIIIIIILFAKLSLHRLIHSCLWRETGWKHASFSARHGRHPQGWGGG